jgi:uncharacterized protein (TIGR00645 family)
MNKKVLSTLGKLMFEFRFMMSFFYLGLLVVILLILFKFLKEVYYLVSLIMAGSLTKMDLIIKVLELVDITMISQLVWVVALAGFSLFVTAEHFDKEGLEKPDWLDHVNTYNLKLKLAFAIISISGVHALKTYLQGGIPIESMLSVVLIHFVFVLCAVGIAYAERITKSEH